MSQFYDQASLVMVPSGYKAGKVYSQKPLSTDGELTFTRNSNATRVNADGLVEKVRTNVLLYSNTFSNAAWTVYSGSPTLTLVNNNATAPDGTQTASTLNYTAIGGAQQFFQNVSLPAGTYNTSIYLRSATGSSLSMAFGFYDGSNKNENITVGTTWQRFDVSKTVLNTTVRCCWLMANELNASVEIWNAQTEVSDFGPTEYIPTTSAAVSVGPTANVPRLNYSNGCPSLLLEPQRTNLALYSEQLNNAAWTNNSIITPNSTTSPDGYENADLLTTSASLYFIAQQPTVTTSPHTFSIYAKKGNWDIFRIGNYSSATNSAYFDLTNGTTGNVLGGTSEIINVGGGWYRCIYTANVPVNTSNTVFYAPSISMGTATQPPAGSTMYFWGAQVEAGSYATSYIPTLGASVTRLADAAYKTGISSLINSTEGVLFFEMEALADDLTYRGISLSDGTFNNLVQIRFQNTSNSIAAQCRVSNSNEALITAPFTTTQKNKIAWRYKQNDFALFINGELKGTYTSGSTFTANTLTTLRTDRGDGSDIFYGELSQALILPALTNAQLAELTAL